MATVDDLALRVLRKIKVLGATEPAAPEDLAVAAEKVRAAHRATQAEGLCQWTLADIPPVVEEPYVAMAAYLAADDFVSPKDASWWLIGMRQVQAFVHVPLQAGSSFRVDDY